MGVTWAIFSDNYRIWRSSDKHEWYEKDPDKVTNDEFAELLKNFDKSLENFDEIFFYRNRGRFHNLYKKIASQKQIKKEDKINFSSCGYLRRNIIVECHKHVNGFTIN